MNADDLAAALTTGASGWLVLSIAAILPILWAFTLAMHFARPYVIRFLQRLTLRFGGDVWWLSYVLIRDGLMVITFGLSLVFLFPNLYLKVGRPDHRPARDRRPAPGRCSSSCCGDCDDEPGGFRLVSTLLVIASVLYIVPQVYGLEAADQTYLGDLPNALTEHRQPGARAADPVAQHRPPRHHQRRPVRAVPDPPRPAGRRRGDHGQPRGRGTGRVSLSHPGSTVPSPAAPSIDSCHRSADDRRGSTFDASRPATTGPAS